MSDIVEDIAHEFLEVKETMEKVGFEVVGTKSDAKDETYFIVKKTRPY